MKTFTDRQDAGRQLAKALKPFRGQDAVVLALPRGGIVLGLEVAKELKIPLGVVLVRKIGHPAYAEYAIGAVVEGDEPLYNQSEMVGLDEAWLKEAEQAVRALMERRRRLYYGKDLAPPAVKGKTVILVDDGIATGLTMEAAVRAMRRRQTKRVIVAVPVAPRDIVERLKTLADEVVVLDRPEDFLGAVGAHYQEFTQVDDEEVTSILREAQRAT